MSASLSCSGSSFIVPIYAPDLYCPLVCTMLATNLPCSAHYTKLSLQENIMPRIGFILLIFLTMVHPTLAQVLFIIET